MAIPTPEPGLTISYAYVWDREAQSGQEEGRKDRPCVIALAVERQPDGETLVTVSPVTHRPPADPAAAVEIPPAVKKYLGLDGERSWVTVSEGDQFIGLVTICEKFGAPIALTTDFYRPDFSIRFWWHSGHGTNSIKYKVVIR